MVSISPSSHAGRYRVPGFSLLWLWLKRIAFWGDTMKASSLSFRAAVVLVAAGMLWGIVMGITEDHSTMPAHAHLNLLGWVSLFLFGIYYHLHPAIDRTRAALVQVWVWIAATVVMAIGVALAH